MSPAIYGVVNKARQAMQDKDYGKAVQIIKDFIKKYPKRSHYLTEFTLANALSLSGKEQEALSHYRSSVKQYPEFPYAWQNMGKVYFDLKQYKTAGDCLLKGYEVSETRDPSLLYFASVSYLLAGKHKTALPHLKRLVSGKAGPPQVEWLEAFLQVCMELRLQKEAFDTVQSLLDKDGDNPRWWKILANLHLQDGDYKKGVAALTIYSYLSPLKKDELLLLGNLNCAIGLPMKASQYYEQSIAMQSNVKPADYERLASAYLAAHKPGKAKEALKQALKKKPTYKLWSMLGHVLYEEENFDKAYRAFKQAARLNRKDGKAHLIMGYCALQMDKKNMARAAFQKAASFPKQRKTAKELLGQIASLSSGAL
ncbi:MAG: tetratricopeptide repeat protein [Proteobacteria bacterium]|nr:tetratricopeptide repeat protein [Pseudomonadota bacterium]